VLTLNALGDAPDHLGEDHSGITASTGHGAPSQSVGDAARTADVVLDRLGGIECSPHREQQIGAGIRIRDGKDVEAVDLTATFLEAVDRPAGPAPQQMSVRDGFRFFGDALHFPH